MARHPAGTEVFNRRDIEAAAILGSAEFELHPPREFIQLGFAPCYRGRAGLRNYVLAWSEAFSDLRVEPVELVDLGDRVVLLANLPWRGQASGLPLTEKIATVSVMKHGKAISVQVYLDHAEALEAVGMRM